MAGHAIFVAGVTATISPVLDGSGVVTAAAVAVALTVSRAQDGCVELSGGVDVENSEVGPARCASGRAVTVDMGTSWVGQCRLQPSICHQTTSRVTGLATTVRIASLR
jgi:hypothetical protein